LYKVHPVVFPLFVVRLHPNAAVNPSRIDVSVDSHASEGAMKLKVYDEFNEGALIDGMLP